MKLTSESFSDGERIPEKNAFGKHDAESHVALTDNENPQLTWSDLPADTRSLALIVSDPDVPSKPDDVNQEGRTVPADLPRVDFYHWVLVDLPREAGSIAEGSLGKGVVPRGKDADGPRGRRGKNDYTAWFAGDADMAGDYFGYDGPCPPWNDEIVHHYHFTLYALDVEHLEVAEGFGGADVVKAIEGHVLAQASIVGMYAINPNAK